MNGRLRWLSLFSGCGGLDLGLIRAGHTIVAHSEADKDAAECYARHFPHVPHLGPVQSIDPDSVPPCDAICGGFPCQPFSLAGARLGSKDSRGTLAFALLELARSLRPKFLLLENVPGLLSSAGGADFGAILVALDALRYNAEWQCVNGVYWLPQNRDRLFIVGRPRPSSPGQVLPVPPCPEAPARARGRAEGKGQQLHADHLHAGRGRRSATGAIDATYAKGGGQRTVVASPYGPYRVRSGAGAYADTLKTPTGGGTTTSLYAVELLNRRRARPFREGVAPAVRTKRNVCVPEDGRAVRRLTPAECERLQGLPPGWTEGYSDTTRYRLIGNAVMVPVAEYLGDRIREAATAAATC